MIELLRSQEQLDSSDSTLPNPMSLGLVKLTNKNYIFFCFVLSADLAYNQSIFARRKNTKKFPSYG